MVVAFVAVYGAQCRKGRRGAAGEGRKVVVPRTTTCGRLGGNGETKECRHKNQP